jgi:protein-L-isoaspartate(D-aspartate) O-methyltransferase
MDQRTARMNMVESQVRTSDVTDLDLIEAMRKVRRERFCAPARAFAAYADVEPEICPGRSLMRPRDVGKLLQTLGPRAGETALAIAAPYAAAVLSEMGVSIMAQEGDARAAAVVGPPLEEAGVRLMVADLKAPEGSGFDLMVCEAAVFEVPEAWTSALKPGGRLGVVVRDGPVGKARIYVRIAKGASFREVFDSTPPLLPGFEKAPTFQF